MMAVFSAGSRNVNPSDRLAAMINDLCRTPLGGGSDYTAISQDRLFAQQPRLSLARASYVPVLRRDSLAMDPSITLLVKNWYRVCGPCLNQDCGEISLTIRGASFIGLEMETVLF